MNYTSFEPSRLAAVLGVLSQQGNTMGIASDGQTKTADAAGESPTGPRHGCSFRLSTVLTLIAVIAIICAFWVNVISPGQHMIKSSLCSSNLVKLHHALWYYDVINGSLPPAYVNGSDGNPAHSWRVLILPHLDSWGIDGEAIYGAYDFSEPWNGPNNRKLPIPVSESRFACPCGLEQETILTSYVVLVGPNTLFPGCERVSLSDIPETSDPILVIEITRSDIQWTEPRDLTIESIESSPASSALRLSRSHASRFRYITARGKLGELPPETTIDEIKRLADSGVSTSP
jgi:hypothetical protein